MLITIFKKLPYNIRLIGFHLPNLGFLGLSVLQLCRGTPQTDGRTDRQIDWQPRAIYNAPSPMGREHNNGECGEWRISMRVQQSWDAQSDTSSVRLRAGDDYRELHLYHGRRWKCSHMFGKTSYNQTVMDLRPMYLICVVSVSVSDASRFMCWCTRLEFSSIIIKFSKLRPVLPSADADVTSQLHACMLPVDLNVHCTTIAV